MNNLFFLVISSSILLFSRGQFGAKSDGHSEGLQKDTAKTHQKEKSYKVEFYRQIVLRGSGTTTYKRTSLNIGTFSVSLTNGGDGYYNIDGTEYYLKFMDWLSPERNKGMLRYIAGKVRIMKEYILRIANN